MGKVFESKYRSYGGITISPKTKNIDSRDNYPGPGAYTTFSEFGIYNSCPTMPNATNDKINSEIKEEA